MKWIQPCTGPQTVRQRTTEKDWTKHKPRILELLKQRKPLTEIQKIIEREAGFHATKSQYKTRFKAWNKKRYFTQKQRCFIIHQLEKRDRRAMFRFQGEDEFIDDTRIQNVWNHRGREDVSLLDSTSSPGGLVVVTPEPFGDVPNPEEKRYDDIQLGNDCIVSVQWKQESLVPSCPADKNSSGVNFTTVVVETQSQTAPFSPPLCREDGTEDNLGLQDATEKEEEATEEILAGLAESTLYELNISLDYDSDRSQGKTDDTHKIVPFSKFEIEARPIGWKEQLAHRVRAAVTESLLKYIGRKISSVAFKSLGLLPDGDYKDPETLTTDVSAYLRGFGWSSTTSDECREEERKECPDQIDPLIPQEALSRAGLGNRDSITEDVEEREYEATLRRLESAYTTGPRMLGCRHPKTVEDLDKHWGGLDIPDRCLKARKVCYRLLRDYEMAYGPEDDRTRRLLLEYINLCILMEDYSTPWLVFWHSIGRFTTFKSFEDDITPANDKSWDIFDLVLNALCVMYHVELFLDMALIVGEQIWKVCLEKHGEEHPKTICAVINYGRHLLKLYRIDDGLSCFRQAKKYEHLLSHEDTVSLRGWVAEALMLKRDLSKFVEAMFLADLEHQDGQVVRRSNTYVRTRWSVSKLGNLMIDRGKIEKAIGFIQRAITMSKITDGSEHRNTIAEVTKMTKVLTVRGMVLYAMPLANYTVEQYQKRYGPYHLKVMEAIGDVCRIQKRCWEIMENEEEHSNALPCLSSSSSSFSE